MKSEGPIAIYKIEGIISLLILTPLLLFSKYQEPPSAEGSPEPQEPKTKREGEKDGGLIKPPKKTARKKSGKRSAGKTPKTKKDSKEKEQTVQSGPKSPPAKEKPTERLVLGECREEKAAYMKVREAKMLHLCDKVVYSINV